MNRLPEAWTFPQAAIDQWVKVPDEHELEGGFTRKMADNLFFAVDKLINSQAQMQTCLIRYTNGQVEDANAALLEAQALTIESQNRLRQFMTDLMLRNSG